MRCWLEPCLALALGTLLACSARATTVPQLDLSEALRASQSVIGSTPPDAILRDTAERPVALSRFRGKPLLVSFIYTGCFTICPNQTRMLLKAVRGLDRMLGLDRYNVVSIGFNQPFDTPQALRYFAAHQSIDYDNWAFLSPARDQVEALTRSFGFSYVETPAGFDHIVGVTVLDADGRIHAQVYGDQISAAALGTPLRELILSLPAAHGGGVSLASLIDRVRILCTVYDPETGEYRYDWTLVLQLVTGLAFFVSVGVYLFREWRSQRRTRVAAGARRRPEPRIEPGPAGP